MFKLIHGKNPVVIKNVIIQPVYYGSFSEGQFYDQFYADIATSGYLAAAAEYGIANGKALRGITVPGNLSLINDYQELKVCQLNLDNFKSSNEKIKTYNKHVLRKLYKYVDSKLVFAMRDFDIIVFGATGYTGKLVVTYLAQNHPTVKIAIAKKLLLA